MELEPNSQAWVTCHAAYLERFPGVEYVTSLVDIKFFWIQLNDARQVAGFGAARSVDEEKVRLALGAIDCNPADNPGLP